MPTRREFLYQSILMASAVSSGILSAFGASQNQKAEHEYDDFIVIDGLGGIHNINTVLKHPTGIIRSLIDFVDERSIRDLKRSGVTALNLTLGYTEGPVKDRWEPYEIAVGAIRIADQFIAEHPGSFIKVNKVDDILDAKKTRKIGIIYGFQSAASVCDNSDNIEIFSDLGVRIIQLTYNSDNQIGGGSMSPANLGLTPFGREVVARLNQEKVIVDLAHSSEQACLDAIEASEAPIVISHTGCRAIADLPRNKSDRELRLMAEKGGLVGIYAVPVFLRTEGQSYVADVIHHIDHAINVCGEDHVGIGTDDVPVKIDDLQAAKEMWEKARKMRKEMGVAATGEATPMLPFLPDMQGPEIYRILTDKLRAHGYTMFRIEKVMGRNWLRIMSEVWS